MNVFVFCFGDEARGGKSVLVYNLVLTLKSIHSLVKICGRSGLVRKTPM
jgi:hypothetical protein